jgi:hypothetical protein
VVENWGSMDPHGEWMLIRMYEMISYKARILESSGTILFTVLRVMMRSA